MFARYKRRFRNLAFKLRRLVGLERNLVLMGDVRAQQLRDSKSLDTLAEAEFSVFSQWGEDGILRFLSDIIDIENETFVEFGVEDYRESNTRYLLMSQNWSGAIIDGSQQNIDAVKGDDISYKHDLTTICAFINKDNINALIDSAGLGNRLGLLSVDIDGVDYWVLEQIETPADIVVVEYNDFFGERPVTVPYDPEFVRLDKHQTGIYWGASLACFKHLLERKDYTFVGSNRAGTNAFFIANKHVDRIKKRLKNFQSYPCKMREARTLTGELSYKKYEELSDLVAELPLYDVATKETISVREARNDP